MSTWRTIEPAARPFVRAVLSKARDRDIRDVGPTKLLGILYLLDAAHWARYREQATPIDWIWKDYGPFDRDAAYDAKGDPYVEEETFTGQYAGSVYRLKVDRTFVLEERIDLLLDEVMGEFGGWNGTAIKRYCYLQTRPMIDVQEHGTRGDRLNMELARIEGSPDPANVEAIKRAVDALGGDRPGESAHDKSFLSLIEEGLELRRRANTRILNDG